MTVQRILSESLGGSDGVPAATWKFHLERGSVQQGRRQSETPDAVARNRAGEGDAQRSRPYPQGVELQVVQVEAGHVRLIVEDRVLRHVERTGERQAVAVDEAGVRHVVHGVQPEGEELRGVPHAQVPVRIAGELASITEVLHREGGVINGPSRSTSHCGGSVSRRQPVSNRTAMRPAEATRWTSFVF